MLRCEVGSFEIGISEWVLLGGTPSSTSLGRPRSPKNNPNTNTRPLRETYDLLEKLFFINFHDIFDLKIFQKRLGYKIIEWIFYVPRLFPIFTTFILTALDWRIGLV